LYVLHPLMLCVLCHRVHPSCPEELGRLQLRSRASLLHIPLHAGIALAILTPMRDTEVARYAGTGIALAIMTPVRDTEVVRAELPADRGILDSCGILS
ncbi:hypothetical protein JKP88DRAFT_218476, partial [Tribonema minus]